MTYDSGMSVVCLINDLEFHIREVVIDDEPIIWDSIIENRDPFSGYILSISNKHTQDEISKLIFAIEKDSYDEESINLVRSTINNNSHNHGVKDFSKIKSIFFDINSVFISLVQNG